MAKGYRVWIEVEEFETGRNEDAGEPVPLDFEPSATFLALRDDELSIVRAKDRAVGFAERLHELAAIERAS